MFFFRCFANSELKGKTVVKRLATLFLVLTLGLTPAVMASQPKKPPPSARRYTRSLDVDAGAPRTVRTVFFLPSDRPYPADKVERLKGMIQHIQRVFRVQMNEHGHGERTFEFESDAGGNPLIHRFDAAHPEIHYEGLTFDLVTQELEAVYDLWSNIYIIVVDNSTNLIEGALGIGSRWSKVGGIAMMPSGETWVTLAHELGHACGLEHDFRDSAYLMSYGPGEERLSPCSSRYLAVHPYFNTEVSGVEREPPSVELVSPVHYTAGAASIPIELRISDSDGLHQALLYAVSGVGALEVSMCYGVAGGGDTSAMVSLVYDGIIHSDGPDKQNSLSIEPTHPLVVEAVDTDGNSSWTDLVLSQMSPHGVATLDGAFEALTTVAFSTGGKTLAAGTWEGPVELWDVRDRSIIGRLEGHSDYVTAAIFSPDGRWLATSARANRIKMWELATGEIALMFGEEADMPLSLEFSPGGEMLAAGMSGGRIKLWDAATGSPIGSLESHTDAVTAVQFFPDGKTLASGSWDGTVLLWDVASEAVIGTLKDDDGDWGDPPVDVMALSPDGETLAAGLVFGIILVWNVGKEQLLHTLFAHREGVAAVTFSPDGMTLASGSPGGAVKLWDMANGEQIIAFGHTTRVNGIDWSSDGRLIASATEAGTIELWDTSWLNPDYEASVDPTDVNGDGVVNILDMVLVASHMGDKGAEVVGDVNADGVVDILDLVAVANAVAEST